MLCWGLWGWANKIRVIIETLLHCCRVGARIFRQQHLVWSKHPCRAHLGELQIHCKQTALDTVASSNVSTTRWPHGSNISTYAPNATLIPTTATSTRSRALTTPTIPPTTKTSGGISIASSTLVVYISAGLMAFCGIFFVMATIVKCLYIHDCTCSRLFQRRPRLGQPPRYRGRLRGAAILVPQVWLYQSIIYG